MNYSMTRFGPRDLEEQKSLVELIQDTTKTVIAAASLSDMVKRRRQKEQADERAKRAVKLVMENLASEEKDAAIAEGESYLMRIIGKIVLFVGRKLFEYVVRPIFTFAARMAMTIVRFALNTLVRFVIIPIIEVAMAFVIANPLTAAVFVALAAVGGAYWIWDQFFRTETKPPPTPPAMPQPSGEAGPVVAGPPELAPPPAPRVASTFRETPVAYSRDSYETVARRKKAKTFEGFGEDIDGYIKEAAALSGISEDVLRGFIKMEAGWTGRMSPTGAIGTGQFIQPTWDNMARTAEGRAIGMTVIGSNFRRASDPRFDKRINTLATGLLAKNNAAMLVARGIPVTGENLYMMHNIGPGIIPVMLGQPVSSATLLAMQQNGMLANQTPAQFLIWQKGRFAEHFAAANTRTTVASGDATSMKDGIIVPGPQAGATVGLPVDAANKNSPKGNKTDRTIVRGNGKTLVGISNG